MPGVIVRTATRSGPVNALVPTSGRYFVVGLTERGRSDKPVKVRSLAEFEVYFGKRQSYGAVYDDLRTYFEEGGSEAYVSRVVGPAATVGTLSLVDGAATPVPTVAIDALGAGAWSSRVTIEVLAAAGGSRKLVVRLDGAVVEQYDRLGAPSEYVSALERSAYVRARDLGSATASPTNRPKVAGPVSLSAGVDDRAAVTATHLSAGLARFEPGLGAGVVAAPGYASSVMGAQLLEHARTHRRLFLTSTAAGATVTDAVNAAATFVEGNDGEYGGLVYPWVRIPLAGTTTKLVSPEGYAAAMRARAHRLVGPWRAPAGELAVAEFVLEPERELSRAEGDQLDEGNVSAIRSIAGTTRLYGWRSLSNDVSNYALLIGRDVLNTLAVEAELRLEQYVFRTIDGKGQLLSEVAAELVGLVDPMRAAGGLYERLDDAGAQLDPGYSVDVGPSVNTDAVLNANEVHAVLAVRVSPVGALIDLTIVKAGLTATV